jgi:anaerobic selenocysteine-containing dehydrogenase
MTRTHFRTCNLCEAMCGIAIELEGERIVSIRGDEDDPLSRGYICPKAVALQDLQSDPDRLRQPMRRTGNGFEPISWEEAFTEVAKRLRSIRKDHGRDAVAIYFGNPTVHNYGALTFALLLLETLKTRNRFSATSADQLPRMLSSLLLFGNQLLMPVPDIDRTSFFLCIGGNPLASNGSLMTAPNMAARLKAVRARGGRVVVIDPRRTETAALADAHHFIRPGADAWLLLAMVHTLFEEGLTRLGRLADFVDGLGEVRAVARELSPESVASRVGIEAATIRGLARDFAAAPSAVCYGRVGTSTQEFGGLCAWLVDVINILTGNLDRPGGAMFTRPAVDLVSAAARVGLRGSFDTFRSRVRGLPEFGGELPVATLAEEIESEGEGRIRGLITLAGNPVLSTPNGRRLDGALARLDFMVSIDFYLNETTRHAHVILPPTTTLEHDHFDIALHLLAVRNTAKYSPPLFAPPADARHDWEILLELSTRLGESRIGQMRGSATRWALRKLGPRGALDLAVRLGPHGDRFNPVSTGLSLRKLERHAHGIDLGPLEPCLPQRLGTEDRRIHLAPAPFVRDLERLRRFTPSNGALSLIGRRDLRSNNSWMHNSARLVKGKERCTLLMHPDDAAARGLASGDRARISSRVGSVVAPVVVSEEMMRGVVSLPHGWGHERPGIRMEVARQRPGVSINDLTDEQLVDALTGNASFSGVPVEVVRCP